MMRYEVVPFEILLLLYSTHALVNDSVLQAFIVLKKYRLPNTYSHLTNY